MTEKEVYFFSVNFFGTLGWYVLQVHVALEDFLAMDSTVEEISLAICCFMLSTL